MLLHQERDQAPGHKHVLDLQRIRYRKEEEKANINFIVARP
jgi:hypothetical protein